MAGRRPLIASLLAAALPAAGASTTPALYA
ncbi:MAG: hypothetical protein AVDCRST_MAG08-597, partial [uncultured Acetobacteraceae bacterium]